MVVLIVFSPMPALALVLITSSLKQMTMES